jgi:hypothetical protein
MHAQPSPIPEVAWAKRPADTQPMLPVEVAAIAAALAPCLLAVPRVILAVRARREDIPAVARALARMDTHETLTAESADELREKIKADCRAGPAPRDQ